MPLLISKESTDLKNYVSYSLLTLYDCSYASTRIVKRILVCTLLQLSDPTTPIPLGSFLSCHLSIGREGGGVMIWEHVDHFWRKPKLKTTSSHPNCNWVWYDYDFSPSPTKPTTIHHPRETPTWLWWNNKAIETNTNSYNNLRQLS